MEEVKQGYQSLSHSKWDCKYHIVFIPKKRRKTLFGQVRGHLGKIFHVLAQQKECQILEGHFASRSCSYVYCCSYKFAKATFKGLAMRGQTR